MDALVLFGCSAVTSIRQKKQSKGRLRRTSQDSWWSLSVNELTYRRLLHSFSSLAVTLSYVLQYVGVR